MNNLGEAISNTRNTLVILPLVFFCFIPVWQDRKDTSLRLLCKVAFSVAAMLLLMFVMYLFLPENLDNLINMILCISIFFWLYQREINLERSHLWFVFCTACLVGSVSYLFSHVMSVLLYPDATIHLIAGNDLFLLQVGFEWAEIAVLFYPVKKYLGWLAHHFHEESVWRLFWILPCGFTFFSMYFIPYDNSVMKMNRFLSLYIAVLLVLLALIVFLYLMFYKAARSMVERQELTMKAAALELQAEQYSRLQLHVQETGRLRHDFRHQLTVIGEMVSSGKYQELEEYLSNYISGIPDMPVLYGKSAAVNAILNHYRALCSEEQIEARFVVALGEIPEGMEIEFCVLLGNLLENAVEACRKLSEETRYISLKIRQTSANFLALQISNPYSGSVKSRGEHFLSSKHGGEGQGLKSVQATAKRYDGSADVDFDGNIFRVRVMLTA